MKFGMPTLLELETIEENAVLCAKLGLQFVELNMNLPTCQDSVLADGSLLLKCKETYGISFTLHLDETLNIADFNRRVADAYLETVLRAIDVAVQLEMPTITMHMNPGVYFTLPNEKIFLYAKYREQYLERMRYFRDVCTAAIGKRSIRICIENTSGFPDFLQEAVELLLTSPVFGLTFDIGHFHGAGEADKTFLSAHENRICHFHLHDAKGRQDHMALGTGEIRLSERLALAKRLHARCVLETKTVAALTDSVVWLEENGWKVF